MIGSREFARNLRVLGTRGAWQHDINVAGEAITRSMGQRQLKFRNLHIIDVRNALALIPQTHSVRIVYSGRVLPLFCIIHVQLQEGCIEIAEIIPKEIDCTPLFLSGSVSSTLRCLSNFMLTISIHGASLASLRILETLLRVSRISNRQLS